MHPAATLPQLLDFLLVLDGLKTVNRRTYIKGGERVENSAEHSWHLALACWAFAEFLPDELDVLKLVKMALIHDLGEIEAGDTFLYSPDRNSAYLTESGAIEKLAAHPGNPVGELETLWREQESGLSPEARLLKVIDRLLPFLHNLASAGRAWQENGIRKKQVLDMHQFIGNESTEIHDWFLAKVEFAVQQGWLHDA